MYTGVAFLFEQDLNAEYDQHGEDWITELVIQDIISGKVIFDTSMKKIEKEEYKQEMKNYRQRKRKNCKKNRTKKRAN